jgi:Mg-chelatase subunit ChlD
MTCIVACLSFLAAARGQSQRRRPKPSTPSSTASPSPTPAAESIPNDILPEAETVKTDTNLVMVPVIATNIDGLYVPDLRQQDFSIWEDDTQQEIAFFATVNTPFHVVLMLDTSGSTKEKLSEIQSAAAAFVDQLKPADRVKVISFDDKVRDLNDFTNDRALLKAAIYKTRSGEGTKLYDAFKKALQVTSRLQGRKAIVVFTDGVDWYSDDASYESTMRGLDEEGVIIYPIRYDTRADTERMIREQQGNNLPTIDIIRRPAPGTTPPTFPSDDPNSTTTGTRSNSRIRVITDDIMRGRRTNDPNRDPRRDPNDPSATPPPGTIPSPTGTIPGSNDPRPTVRGGDPTSIPGRAPRRDDSTTVMLDQMYMTADSYLGELAKKSGGRLLRADTLSSLPDAFAKIAGELGQQYALGYYPTNKARDGQYRRIKVASSRKKVMIRARPGYRAPSE